MTQPSTQAVRTLARDGPSALRHSLGHTRRMKLLGANNDCLAELNLMTHLDPKLCRFAAGAAVARRTRAGGAGAAAREAAGAGGVWQSGLRGAHPRQVLLQREACSHVFRTCSTHASATC